MLGATLATTLTTPFLDADSSIAHARVFGKCRSANWLEFQVKLIFEFDMQPNGCLL
jgi:hypothetical protein